MKIGSTYSGSATSFISNGLIVEGNVGIGTTGPTATLHLGSGAIKFPDGSTQASGPLVQSTFIDLPNASLWKSVWTVGASHTVTGPAVISVHWHALCAQGEPGLATYTAIYVDGVVVSQYGGLRQPATGAVVQWFDCTNLYMGTIGTGSHTIEMKYWAEGTVNAYLHQGRLSTMAWKQ